MNDANLDITSGTALGLTGTTLVAQLHGPSLAPGSRCRLSANGTEYSLALDICRYHVLRDGIRRSDGDEGVLRRRQPRREFADATAEPQHHREVHRRNAHDGRSARRMSATPRSDRC